MGASTHVASYARILLPLGEQGMAAHGDVIGQEN
jgi:hypothetical protein